MYAKRAIKRINKKYKLNISKVFRIGIYGICFQSWHYDCIYKCNDEYFLVNYGFIIKGKTIESCLQQLAPYFMYRSPRSDKTFSFYPSEETIYWKCLW